MFGAKEGEKMREELEKFRRRVLHVRRILCNPKVTRFTLVTIPEKMGINETMRAYESLAEFNLPVSGCVVNRLTPDIENEFIQTRRKHERENVDQLKNAIPNMHIHEIELKDSDIHGLDLLRDIGNELHGKISIEDGFGPFEIGLGLQVNRGTWRDSDDVYLHLPGICLLYTSPSPRDATLSRMPSSA